MDSKRLLTARWLAVFVTGLFLLAACQVTREGQPPDTPVPIVIPETAAPTETAVPTEAAVESEPTAAPEPTTAETPMPESTVWPVSGGTADADVTFVRAVQAGDGSWTFHVTVSHPDSGWDDYADGWDVVLPDGAVLKRNESDTFTRLLLHPHETEQPFTRSQSGLTIPDGVTQVTVRAHDLLDGFGGQEVVVNLTAESGPDFEVETS